MPGRRLLFAMIFLSLLCGTLLQIVMALRWHADRQSINRLMQAKSSNGYLAYDQGRLWEWTHAQRTGWTFVQAVNWPNADFPGTLPSSAAFRDQMIQRYSRPTDPPGWSRIVLLVEAHGASQFAMIDAVQVGWPMRCIEFVHADYCMGTAVVGGKTLRGTGLSAASGSSDTVAQWLRGRWTAAALPTAPLWAGLLGNFAFFVSAGGLIWWLIRRVKASQARRRRARGLCAACGYPLDAQSSPAKPCPECGIRDS